MVEVRRAALQLHEEPSRIDRTRLEEEWRQVEASLQRMRPTTPRDEPEGAVTGLRRVSQLLPQQLRQRLEQHLQALLRGDHVDREELQSLVVEARQQTELTLAPRRSTARRALSGDRARPMRWREANSTRTGSHGAPARASAELPSAAVPLESGSPRPTQRTSPAWHRPGGGPSGRPRRAAGPRHPA